jgi:GT2 family glycosyltransferase
MTLTVIIVSFNVKDYLEECLKSVMLASGNIDCEIFVVDNNSVDGSSEMITKIFPSVNLIINKVNIGFSSANNQAIQLAKGQFVLILNPDTVVEPDTFIKCLNFMKSHPDAGALGVRMVNGEGSFLPESKRSFPTLRTAFFKSFGFSSLFPTSQVISRYYLPGIDMMETSPTEVISGAFMFLRQEALKKSGLFDESFFMYGEDIDLSYRLMKTGFKNYYVPEVRIVHFKGMSTDRNGYNDILHFYEAMRIYVLKRASEGKFGPIRVIINSAIYLREGLALARRAIRISFQR